MRRTLRYLILLVLIGVAGAAFGQGIYGRIVDEKSKQPIPSAIVQAFQGGVLRGGAATDYDGNYNITPLDAGYYFLVVTYLSYDTEKMKDVIVPPNGDTKVDFALSQHAIEANVKKPIIVRAFKKPLVGSLTHTVDAAEMKTMPTTQVVDVAASSPGSHQSKRGEEINMGGARVEGTQYIIDGVVVQYIAGNRSGVDLSQGSVEQMEVMMSGVEAKYGDVSGGVVSITTRGPSQKLNGDVLVQHSIDGYNNNLASFSVSGPLLKQKIKGDPNQSKKTVMGFALSGDYYDDHNRYPGYIPTYEANSDYLKKLRQNPLRLIPDNSGNPNPTYASNFVTANDIHTTSIPPNNEIKEYRLNGKIDYQPNELLHFVAGTSIDYVSKDLYSRGDALFAPEAIPKQNNLAARGFVRFTQKFSKSGDTSHSSLISNAYYTLQADFQRESTETQDPRFKKNIFDYAYIGKFTNNRSNSYLTGQKDSASNLVGTIYQGSLPQAITFTPSTMNTNLANYTSELFNYLGGLGNRIGFFYPNQIQNSNGLMNGDEPLYTYGLYLSPGATQYYYSNSVFDQYSVSVDASFDLKTGKIRHAIQFGLYYQQRVARNFSVEATLNGSGTQSLWYLMRQSVNSVDNGGLYLDKTHPGFIVNGQTCTGSIDPATGRWVVRAPNGQQVIFNATDTIVYNYLNKGNSAFDRNLRKKLGYTGTKDSTRDINIDALDPSMFSLDMFSADQLLNQGHSYVNYAGYTYSGGVQSGNVNFNDFWTKKDANGDYTRPIAAFTPNYMAGYLQDKFRFENIKFNIGVRVDRFTTNTKVLIDPYSLYPEKNVSQVSGTANFINSGKHPANIGGNYVVYIDDNNSTSPSVVGYRNGNNWYDPTGKYIEDPRILKQYTGGRDPQPALRDGQNTKAITDTLFNPNYSFTDYTPQVNVMPRIQFSFPISEVADFFAHYDIYTQRPYPNSITQSSPYTYYFMQANNTQIFPNANLKPSKTFDYEIGFQQKLSDHSAMTITGFYKERKDMVTIVAYQEAWPTTYFTYGNKDFSTTKGATLNFDFRTTNTLRMNISYTLQFAEGTGSSVSSGNSGSSSQLSFNGLMQQFIAAGIPNMRYVTSLDYDSRHTIAANIDYRYKEGEGPMVGKKHIFENAGIDLICRARSGEPFTRYAVPDNVAKTVIGGVNGSRLPWHYGFDARIDKDFALNFNHKKVEGEESTPSKSKTYYLKAMLVVNNIFNVMDVLGVYGYTGKPGDNGYLTSSFGQQYAPQQINPTSYSMLYSISNNDPGHYNYARTINFGLEFDF